MSRFPTNLISAIVVLCCVGLLSTTACAQLGQRKKVEPGPKDPDAPKEFSKTDSGLEYRVLRKSDGKKPKATDVVSVHYRGWLDSGQQFDSSYDRGEETSFPLNRVVPGWTEGLQLIGEGGMIELRIPAKLGYGDRGIPNVIPPNSTLHFLVELKSVK